MIVDAIEHNIGTAASTTTASDSRRDSVGGGGAGAGTTPTVQDGQNPPTLVVPPLHRSDGGLGGLRQRRQRQLESDGRIHGATTTTLDGGAHDFYGNSGWNSSSNEEDSSLAVAREFLSRLVSANACEYCIRLLDTAMKILLFMSPLV